MADVQMQPPPLPTDVVIDNASNDPPLLKFAATNMILPPPDLKSQSYYLQCLFSLLTRI